MLRNRVLAALVMLAASLPALATVFATVRGVVHDPQHRPIENADILLRATGSDFVLRAKTNAQGEFEISQVPIGVYELQVSAPNFTSASEPLSIASGTNPVLHLILPIAPTTQSVVVQGMEPSTSASDSVTSTTLITRADIDRTPGASRTTGMEMITDFVPGAYMTHDMLHMRGGHQTSWLIDGVSIPNTKIASNVGPQIDPKDIDSLETQRGSYSSDIGDRTYGVFNVLPRNGFERNRDGEALLSAGNFYSSEAQVSLGDHSAETAWYLSLTGSRSNYGLATPVASIFHDATNSQSGFLSLIRNQTSKDQLRLNAQYRQDYFQIPYDPNPQDWEQASQYYESYGLRDGQTERDSFLIANWVHTLSPKALFSIAPFYHFNQADYDSSANDNPVATTWHQTSNYAGGQGDFHADAGPNNFSAGLYTFYQVENDLFGVTINDRSAASSSRTACINGFVTRARLQPGHELRINGGVLTPGGCAPRASGIYAPGSNAASSASASLGEFYLSDHLRLGRYITLLGGERFTIYHAGIDESAIYPRLGATVEIPRIHWVLRGFYGHFFQPAPLQTVSSAVLDYASSLPQGENTFTPLPSERDEEHQFGIQIPYKGWFLDVANVKNRVNNFLDHSNLGESNMYFPIAVDGALIRAWEMTLRSPQISHFGQMHITYANQIAEQRGNIVGGFTCTIATDPACDLGPDYTPLDHDQRHTLNAGFTANLPLRTWFSTNVYYGSGFSNGLAGAGQGPYNGPYLPVHTTFDISAGHNLGERLRLSASIINVTNHRILLDNSVTIGGFHYNDPRMVSAELRYRFHF